MTTPGQSSDVGKRNDYCDRAERYAGAVLKGKIPACRWVKLACERQLKDREREKDPQFPFKFKRDLGNRICRFVELLPHIKGRWSSRTLRLEDWECFLLTTVFGWVGKTDDLRRFRTAYVEVPRKNGKSSLCAAIGLYMLTADREPGPEVYSAAVTRDQARIVFEIARQMALRTPGLRASQGVEVFNHHLYVPQSAGVFRPLASDADSLDGLNIHCAIIDELHAHKGREVFDAIDTSTGSRQQPLKWIITTAGTNKEGICYEQREFVAQMLEGRVEADRYFGIIYTLDPEDDWLSPKSWRKANPNYGVSVLRDDIETLCKQAQINPLAQANFQTKRLNIWLSGGQSYFNMLAWGHCKRNIAESDYEGYPCWFGLDLASKWDVAAFMRIYRAEDHWAVFGDYYLPEDAVEKGKPNYDLYAGWAQQGRMTLTPGPIIDFAFIERDLADWARRVNPKEICYDPYQATELATRMSQEGLPMVEIPMNTLHISEPMKALGAMILDGSIRHDGDPVFSWMLGNVVAKEDVKGNVYPRKERRENKIDGPVAAMMALSRALSAKEPDWGYADPAMVYV